MEAMSESPLLEQGESAGAGEVEVKRYQSDSGRLTIVPQLINRRHSFVVDVGGAGGAGVGFEDGVS